MKKTKYQQVTNGDKKQRFQMKKCNRQLISVATAGIILLSSYGIVPLQVFASEEAVVPTTESTLPTVSSEIDKIDNPTPSQPKIPSEEIEVEKTNDSVDSTETTHSESEAIERNQQEVAQVEEVEPDRIGTQAIEGDWEYETEITGEGTFSRVTKYNGSQTDVSIPATLGGKRVAIELKTTLRNVLNAERMIKFEIANTGNKSTAVKILDTSFESLFSFQSHLTSADFGNCDTSSVEKMSYMFRSCSELTSLDLINFDTTAVKDMKMMFYGCSELTSLDLINFDTTAVKDMSYMFSGCSGLASLDLINFDTTAVTDTSHMFKDCSELTKLNLSNFDTIEVTKMTSMFYGCSGLTSLDLSGSFNTTAVTDMGNMFRDCSGLTSLDLSHFDTTAVTVIGAMFLGCSGLTSLDLSHFDTTSVRSLLNMFNGCNRLTSLDLSSFDTSKVINMGQLFSSCNELKQLTLSEKFDFIGNTKLRDLPTNRKWLQSKEGSQLNIYSSTADMINGHNQVEEGIYTYTIKQGYSVTFNMNGGNAEGSPDSQFVSDGETCKEPKDKTKFTRTGYTFDGWKYNGNNYDFSHPVVRDIELVASWKANKYTVKFDKNNAAATGEMDNQDFVYDADEVELTQLGYKRPGYTFDKWTTNSNGTGDSYTNEQAVKNLSTGSEITLYAQWKANKYTVKFDKNADTATGEMENQDFVYDANEVKLTLLGFERPGYTFDKWTINSDGTGASYTNEQAVKNLSTDSEITLYAQWKANSYNVKFDNNADTATGEMGNQNFTYDADKVALNELNFERIGYTFEKWAANPDGSGVSYTDKEAVNNLTTGSEITLYAQWKANDYKIHFVADDENVTGSMDSVDAKYDVSQTLPTNMFSRPGYNFAGWKANNVGDVINDGDSVKNLAESGEVTLYAQWTPIKYQIAFDSNTGEETMENLPMTYDVSKELPKNSFTKEGYKFVGWKLSEDDEEVIKDGGDVKNLTTTEGATVTLIAQWTPIEYKIAFDKNTGEGSMNDLPMTYDEPEKLPANTFTKEGYHFVEWTTDLTNGKVFSDEQEDVKNLTTVENETVTLHAVWAPNDYTIVFDKNGGEGENYQLRATYDVSINSLSNQFDRTGYTFTGWNTKENGDGIAYDAIGEVKNLATSGEITLYAQWTAKKYNVNFIANIDGFEGTMAPQELTYDKLENLTENGFSKKGYRFVGWTENQNGSGTFYEDGGEIKNLATEGEITLYGKWELSNYQILFDSNGGQGTMEPMALKYSEEATLTENSFTRAGYRFTGWNTEKNGSGQSYTDKQSVRDLAESGEITLYAQWSANPTPVQQYQVVFDANQGTGIMQEQTFTKDQEATLTKNTFTREGYTFVGWNTKADGSGQAYTDEATVKNLAESGQVTLYAQWEENQEVVDEKTPLYRVYNPNNGEHFFTTNQAEAQGLISLSWIDEGISWYGEKEAGKPVYRLYNPNSGEHFYTLDVGERDAVAQAGWLKEGTAFYAPEEETDIPIYRVYNPNAQDAGSHHYSVSKAEHDYLVNVGWTSENIAFYGK